MTTDEVATLAVAFLHTGGLVAAPAIAVAGFIGALVGVLQTATQVNEPSIAYAAKVLALVALFALIGPAVCDQVLRYTRASFDAIAHVSE